VVAFLDTPPALRADLTPPAPFSLKGEGEQKAGHVVSEARQPLLRTVTSSARGGSRRVQPSRGSEEDACPRHRIERGERDERP